MTRVSRGELSLERCTARNRREYGFSSWTDLKRRIESNPIGKLWITRFAAATANKCWVASRKPALLHIPVRSGNWGPPMSHAANLGRLEIVKAIAALGARDLQHAFDRALLQGQIECARWLHGQGAQLVPGIVLGLMRNPEPGRLALLAELHAPFTDQHGDRMAPLALVLETYGRNPKPESTPARDLRRTRLYLSRHSNRGISSRRRRPLERPSAADPED